jgi:hypothetical protein
MIDPHLPAGAQFDPRAPFNEQDDVFCRSCDKAELDQMWWDIEEEMINALCDENGELTPEQEKQVEEAEERFWSRLEQCKECRA